MAEILTLSSGALKSQGEALAPIVNPAGPLPPAGAVSVGAAVESAAKAPIPKDGEKILGIDLKDHSLNNLVFLGVVAFLVYKFGRRIFQ